MSSVIFFLGLAVAMAIGLFLGHAWARVRLGAALVIARQGWLFAGGKIDASLPGSPVVGQLYAEYQIPRRRRHRFPVVMIHGGRQTGTNFTGTPDGRDGWAQYFLREGYAVYVIDQPGRGRAAYTANAYGPLRDLDFDFTMRQFVAPERFDLWPQAHLHTQWPGAGQPGDPAFDGFLASQQPSIAAFATQQSLMRDAGMDLLDRIGPAILLVHSQAGAFAWPIAQARPDLVKAIIAVEPNGPPVHDLESVGAPDWFRDAPALKASGLGDIPLDYSPPLMPGERLRFELGPQPAKPHLARCWLQSDPPRRLVGLDRIPVLMLTAEASYHAPYDICTAAYLRQAGVSVEHMHLANFGITGNGHMMMQERNSDAIAGVIVKWLHRQNLS